MEALLRKIYENRRKTALLKMLSTVCAYITAAFFGVELLLMMLGKSYITALIAAAAAAVGYGAVTLLRALINAKRPYEVYDFYKIPPKDKMGKSFPSRHCYSAFVIATLSWLFGPLTSIGVSILALIIAACRVLTGIHFLRDVLVGAATGLLFGGVGLTIIYLI